METKKNAKKSLLAAALCVLLALAVAAGIWGIQNISAKYVKNVTLNGSVYIETENNAEIKLYEHHAVLQPDGSYLLTTDTAGVPENTYSVLPGVDIPKDPCIYISSLNASSYIYIEVIDTLDAALSWELETCWLEVQGVTGLNGGTVYVYAENGTPTAVTSDSSGTSHTGTESTTTGENTTAAVSYDVTLNIIKNQTVTVSSSYSATDSGALTFYGYVAEATTGDDPAAVFTQFFSSAEATTD